MATATATVVLYLTSHSACDHCSSVGFGPCLCCDALRVRISNAASLAAQATDVAEKLHVPVSETPQWAALAAHVAEIDKTCAPLPTA